LSTALDQRTGSKFLGGVLQVEFFRQKEGTTGGDESVRC
jgi:hypothetical protein